MAYLLDLGDVLSVDDNLVLRNAVRYMDTDVAIEDDLDGVQCFGQVPVFTVGHLPATHIPDTI